MQIKTTRQGKEDLDMSETDQARLMEMAEQQAILESFVKRSGTRSPAPSAEPPAQRLNIEDSMDVTVAPRRDVVLVFDGVEMEGATDPKTIKMTVSSAHLVLKSRVFEAMLDRHQNQEAETLRAHGRVEVVLPDDDYNAFVIVMNVAHGHRRKVPRNVDLDTFARIATLVDKYEWHELMEDHAEKWCQDFSWQQSFPWKLEHTHIPGLWICWVLRFDSQLMDLTEVIIRHRNNAFDLQAVGEHPIPSPLLGDFLCPIIADRADVKARVCQLPPTTRYTLH